MTAESSHAIRPPAGTAELHGYRNVHNEKDQNGKRRRRPHDDDEEHHDPLEDEGVVVDLHEPGEPPDAPAADAAEDSDADSVDALV